MRSKARHVFGRKELFIKCFICNRTLEEDQVQFNENHKDYDPCPTCLDVIEDLLAGYGGQPDTSAEEDKIDLILEGLYPTTYDPFAVDDFA
jgi:hypothetical protein